MGEESATRRASYACFQITVEIKGWLLKNSLTRNLQKLDRVRKLQTILPSLLDIFYHPIFDFFKKNRVFQQPQGIITINCILNWWWERFIRLVQAETTSS
jgi:hypothetical protein